MTVADLLEILKDYDPDAEVWVGPEKNIEPATHVEMRVDFAGRFVLIR